MKGASPLSFAQERLWFLDQYEPHKAVYNIPKAVHLSGRLDRNALQEALDAIVARHETLRTTFLSVEGAPQQVVAAVGRVPMRFVNLTAGNDAPGEEALTRLLQKEMRRPFDLTRDLMLRATLFRLGQEDRVRLVMHHLASDGWSMGILNRDVPSLPELPIQYSDCAQQQRQRMQGEVLDRHVAGSMARPQSAVLSFGSQEAVTIPCLIRRQAELTPDSPAILAPGRGLLSHRRLGEQVEQVVRTLNQAGIKRNDHVAIVLPNGPEMLTAFLGISAAATCAPLNPAYRASEFEFYLSDLNARALIVQSGIDLPARDAARHREIPLLELSPNFEAGSFHLVAEKSLIRTEGGFADPEDVALLIHTSGSTSRPKLVPISHSNLCASALHLAAAFELNSRDRYLNVMPLFHTHSILRTLTSLLSGGSVVCTPGFDAMKFFAWWREFQPTWYSAVPTIHQVILTEVPSHREIVRQYPLRFISTGSAPLSRKTHAELESTLNAPVIQMYGSTETLQAACTPLPPKMRKAGSVGLPVGAEIGIVDESGRPLRRGEVGEVVVRGPSVMRGYVNSPDTNRSAFTGGWFRTGDEGWLDNDGYLFLKGRIKETINRGGEKISPGEVDEVLMAHPSVAQAVTFGTPHPTLGEDVAAAIVLRENCRASEEEIRGFATARLADFRVPRRILIVEEIPKGPSGKLLRKNLAEKFGLNVTSPVAASAEPRTSLERTVAAVWCEVLGVERVGVDDNFFDLGGNSLLAAQVAARVGSCLQAELSVRLLFENATVAGLAAALTRYRAEEMLHKSPDQIAIILTELESLSEEEASERLRSERQAKRSRKPT